MAQSYAARLKKGVDYGVCGTPEFFDSPSQFFEKIDDLVELVKNTKHMVVHTGAGNVVNLGKCDTMQRYLRDGVRFLFAACFVSVITLYYNFIMNRDLHIMRNRRF